MGYSAIIAEVETGINKLLCKRVVSDEMLVKMYSVLYKAIYSEIFGEDMITSAEEKEKCTREILKKYVIGYSHYKGAIKPIKERIKVLSQNKSKNSEILHRYFELLDDFMALASYRSYKHFCVYIEDVFGETFTLWRDIGDTVFTGYLFYANQMVLDGKVKFIEKQLPTGFGKSISDAFMMAFIFGYDKDVDILKVCGNDKFTKDCYKNVQKLMLSAKFSKIFPSFAKYECNSKKMFVADNQTELTFTIEGTKKSTSLRIVTKLSDVNGVRAKYLFLDDITQRSDMGNIKQHNRDIHSFTHEWFERNYNRDNFFIVASGTTYSQFDILSHLKHIMGGEKAMKTNINKYTSVAYSDYIVPKGVSVFVCVPLLDYDTDESTYPKKISTLSARQKRDSNYQEFMAMDMQQPLPPENSPFYFSNLREYESLPKIGEYDRDDTCCASLDPKRRGKDNLSMPICCEITDPENPKEKCFPIVDWLYDDRPMKDCLPLIASKIIQHNITRLYVERNTEECIETLIQNILHSKGYFSCVIEEVYSTVPKDKRIMSAEGDIKAKIIFPKFGLYARSSNVGKALENVYGYSYSGRNEHDDAIDSLALFSKKYISKSINRLATISTFNR